MAIPTHYITSFLPPGPPLGTDLPFSSLLCTLLSTEGRALFFKAPTSSSGTWPEGALRLQTGGAVVGDFLQMQYPTFEPKTVQIIADAFDAAWASIESETKY